MTKGRTRTVSGIDGAIASLPGEGWMAPLHPLLGTQWTSGVLGAWGLGPGPGVRGPGSGVRSGRGPAVERQALRWLA